MLAIELGCGRNKNNRKSFVRSGKTGQLNMNAPPYGSVCRIVSTSDVGVVVVGLVQFRVGELHGSSWVSSTC